MCDHWIRFTVHECTLYYDIWAFMTSPKAILGMIRAAVGTGFQREISGHSAERVDHPRSEETV